MLAQSGVKLPPVFYMSKLKEVNQNDATASRHGFGDILMLESPSSLLKKLVISTQYGHIHNQKDQSGPHVNTIHLHSWNNNHSHTNSRPHGQDHGHSSTNQQTDWSNYQNITLMVLWIPIIFMTIILINTKNNIILSSLCLVVNIILTSHSRWSLQSLRSSSSTTH